MRRRHGLASTTPRGGRHGLCDLQDALVWWTLGSAVELAGRGIRINCVAPGLTATPIIEDTIRSRGEEFLKTIPMPLGRIAQPREQAEVLAFLAGPAASYVSGQVIWLNGGYLAGVASGQIENATGSAGPAPDPVRSDGGHPETRRQDLIEIQMLLASTGTSSTTATGTRWTRFSPRTSSSTPPTSGSG